MPSTHTDYEYDIFISYRHNDNRNRWVTEFVNALQKELSATIKEPLTIYFDVNPHDGLLETHDVDKSLEGKLKSLIFIPIISQTYCDPKSFAWQHEFCAFNKLAQNDQLGRDIKLNNGNVTSRILPIKIHKIDEEDKEIIQNEIGAVLRAIDFIYEEAGVNRPLSPTDDRKLNLEKSDYKNQINKVANAIKELLTAIKKPMNKANSSSTQSFAPPSNTNKKTLLTILGIVALIAIVGYFMFGKNISLNSDEETIEKSIAVLPFENMSNDPEQEYFSDGISEELINALAKMTNLKVAGRTSSFSFKDKHEDLRKVGESLGVNTILEGSVRKSGNTVRITAQLINVKDGFHLWTQTFDRELSDIFKVQDEITEAIIKELRVHLDEEIEPTIMLDVDAYAIYLKARQKLAERGLNNLIEARDLFFQALKLDSTYSPTYSGLSKTLSLLNNYSTGDSRYKNTHMEALSYSDIALKLDMNNSEAYMARGIAKSWYVWDWESAERDIVRSIELNPNDSEVNNFAGDFYRIIADFTKSYEHELRALELDPLHAVNHWDIGTTLLVQGKLEEAKTYYRSCLSLDKELIQLVYPGLIYRFKNDPIINEMEKIYNTTEIANLSESVNLHLKTSFAIGKNELDKAKEYFEKLTPLAEKGFFSAAYMLDYSYLLDYKEKMVYWAKKSVINKDPLLSYESFHQLPELYNNEEVINILSSPELDALYTIRRKNLGLN